MQDTSSPQVLSLTKKGTRRWISRVQLLWNRRHFLTKRSDEETTWQRDNCNSTWVCKCNLQLYMAQWVVILPERASLIINSHPRVPPEWPYCRQAQCRRWFTGPIFLYVYGVILLSFKLRLKQLNFKFRGEIQNKNF